VLLPQKPSDEAAERLRGDANADPLASPHNITNRRPCRHPRHPPNPAKCESRDFFFDVLSADASRISPDRRATYAAAYATDAALTAGFDFYRAFTQDAQDNAESAAGEPVATPLLYVRGAASLGSDVEAYVEGFRAPAWSVCAAASPRRRAFHRRRAAPGAVGPAQGFREGVTALARRDHAPTSRMKRRANWRRSDPTPTWRRLNQIPLVPGGDQ